MQRSANGRDGLRLFAFTVALVGVSLLKWSSPALRPLRAGTLVLFSSALLLAACIVTADQSIEGIRRTRAPRYLRQDPSIDLLPRYPQPTGHRPSAGRAAAQAAAIYLSDGAAARRRAGRSAAQRPRRRGLRPQFRERAGHDGRQGHPRRHTRRRLHDRSARAGHRDARLGASGAKGRRAVRAGKCAAHERRRAGARRGSGYRLLPAAGSGRLRPRRPPRHRTEAGLRHHRRAAAIRIGDDASSSCSTISPSKPGTVRVDATRNMC